MTTEPLDSDVSWQLKKPALLPLLALQLSAWVYCGLLFEIGKRLPDRSARPSRMRNAASRAVASKRDGMN